MRKQYARDCRNNLRTISSAPGNIRPKSAIRTNQIFPLFGSELSELQDQDREFDFSESEVEEGRR